MATSIFSGFGEVLGRVLRGSGKVLGGFWEGLGASWPLLGTVRAASLALEGMLSLAFSGFTLFSLLFVDFSCLLLFFCSF